MKKHDLYLVLALALSSLFALGQEMPPNVVSLLEKGIETTLITEAPASQTTLKPKAFSTKTALGKTFLLAQLHEVRNAEVAEPRIFEHFRVFYSVVGDLCIDGAKDAVCLKGRSALTGADLRLIIRPVVDTPNSVDVEVLEARVSQKRKSHSSVHVLRPIRGYNYAKSRKEDFLVIHKSRFSSVD
jgi:hypothetical protein